jgi:hypothetical protein
MNEQALPLGSRSPLEPTSSLRLTCLLARFCRFRGERLYQRPVRCLSGLGLEMGRRSCWCYCEVRTTARRRQVQSHIHVAAEVCGIGSLRLLLETNSEHMFGKSPANMSRYESSSLTAWNPSARLPTIPPLFYRKSRTWDYSFYMWCLYI